MVVVWVQMYTAVLLLSGNIVRRPTKHKLAIEICTAGRLSQNQRVSDDWYRGICIFWPKGVLRRTYLPPVKEQRAEILFTGSLAGLVSESDIRCVF